MSAFFQPSELLASCGDYVISATQIDFPKMAAEHAAERSATVATLIFDLVVVVASFTTFCVLRRFIDKLWLRAVVMAVGVLLFELFTAPMWINEHLGRWAYVYCDVSWILTLGWTALILGAVVLVDVWKPQWSAPKRFAAYLGLLLVLVTIAEVVVVGIGIRKYSPEVMASVSGVAVLGVPLEILFYVPVFTALVIAFYKYWSFVIDNVALVPIRKRKWVRATFIAFVGVFLFEVMVEPMAENKHFPAWSYVYNDISFLMTGAWVLLIAITAVLIDRFTVGMPILIRFAAAVMVISALALPIESWMIVNGFRVYGESAVADFSGFTTPLSGVAAEVAFAIPCYMALVITFIRFWEIVLDNRL